MISIDDLVPEDHLVRKIEEVIDFSFIYDLVKDYYSEDKGRTSIDPVVLIKIVLIQYLFGIVYMRKTIKKIETNIAYRGFLGYGFKCKILHFSTFVKTLMQAHRVFRKVLLQVVKLQIINRSQADFVDAPRKKSF